MRKFKNLLFLLIGVSIVVCLYNNWINLKSDTNVTINNEAICYYVTHSFDDFNQQSLSDFLESGSLQNLKELNKELNDNFDYIEFTSQFLETDEYYNGDKKFTTSYGMKEDLTNQKIKINGEITYVTALNAIQINMNSIFKNLGEKVDSGRFFLQSDFNYKQGDTIPVILGYGYKDIYKLEEHLYLNYLFTKVDLQIVGFFKENTTVICENQNILLDNYICMPHFNIIDTPESSEYELFQKRCYLQKNSGYIIAPELSQLSSLNSNKEEIYINYKNKIKDLSEKQNLPYELFEYEVKIDIK